MVHWFKNSRYFFRKHLSGLHVAWVKTIVMCIVLLVVVDMANAQQTLQLTHNEKGKTKKLERGDWVKLTYLREKPSKRLIVNMGVRIMPSADVGYFQGRILNIEEERIAILNVVDTLTLSYEKLIAIRKKPLVGRHVVRMLHAGAFIAPFFLAKVDDVPAVVIGGVVQELTWTPMDDKIYYPMWRLEQAEGKWKLEVKSP